MFILKLSVYVYLEIFISLRNKYFIKKAKIKY